MKTFFAVGPALLGALAVCSPALGQAPAPDQLVAAATEAAQKQYAAAFVLHPQLYSGVEYVDYSRAYHTRTGHQFFDSPEKKPGSVAYNGHIFSNVLVGYDVVLDQVLLSPPGSPLTLRLIDQRVREFTIADHRFVRLVADSLNGKVIRTGYYEVLIDNSVQLLAKRTKLQQERMEHPFVNVEFTSADRLFIRKDGQYHAVGSKSSVVRLFADRGKEVQKYVQERKLKFNKKQSEESIKQLTAYYAGLPPR